MLLLLLFWPWLLLELGDGTTRRGGTARESVVSKGVVGQGPDFLEGRRPWQNSGQVDRKVLRTTGMIAQQH